jgi:hypothetical protein
MMAPSGENFSMHAGLKLVLLATLALSVLFSRAATGFAQVSPPEIVNPRLRVLETTYYPQLIDLNHGIAGTEYPFKFKLARYPGLDPGQQTAPDTRGLEFILFKDHTVLKISGNYSAAFNPNLLTANQRADRVLEDVIVPVLRLLPAHCSSESQFDGIGFEIAYHVRTRDSTYDYEGVEVLTVVFDKAGALGYLNADGESGRQEILNRSLVYLDGKAFGLALGSRDAFDVDGTAKVSWPSPTTAVEAEPASRARAASARAARDSRSSFLNPARDLLQTSLRTSQSEAEKSLAQEDPPADPPQSHADQAAADVLQAKYQLQLDSWGKEGVKRFHFVDYAPPSFTISRNQIHLQITLRNPAPFDRKTTSIYKRAAESFDLFLAPQLKALLDGAPGSGQFAGMAVTVINDLGAGAAHSSEAVEFVCPLRPLQEFVNGEITNQDLVNQSVLFVNGVRIGLNLQQVE